MVGAAVVGLAVGLEVGAEVGAFVGFAEVGLAEGDADVGLAVGEVLGAAPAARRRRVDQASLRTLQPALSMAVPMVLLRPPPRPPGPSVVQPAAWEL